MDMTTQGFDYASLDKHTRESVRRAAGEIKDRLKRSSEDVVEIGRRLIEVKGTLGYGRFGEWLKAEFQWTAMSASRMMRAAEFAKSNNLLDAKVTPSALYLLSSSSTPESVVGDFVGRAERGEVVTHAEVKQVVEARRVPPPGRKADLAAAYAENFEKHRDHAERYEGLAIPKGRP